MSDPNQLTFVQTQMLYAISQGYVSAGQISRTLHLDESQIQTNLDILERLNFVRTRGIRQNYLLTDIGLETISAGRFAGIIQPPQQFNRTEIRHTSNMRTGFGLVFGGIFGAFIALLTISVISSVVIWAAYHLYLKNIIPPALLPIIPLDNFLVDLLISVIGTLSIFLPFRNGGTNLFRRLI